MTNFVLATLLLMAFDTEDEGVPPELNLAAWLSNDLAIGRYANHRIPWHW